MNKRNRPSRQRRERLGKQGHRGHHEMKMDDSVYQLRRQVIRIIYKVNDLLADHGLDALPRIQVRIVDGGCGTAGFARMGRNAVWIPKETIGKDYLYRVVLHELLHAVLATEHDLNCKLMHTHVQPDLTDAEATRIFLRYFGAEVDARAEDIAEHLSHTGPNPSYV